MPTPPTLTSLLRTRASQLDSLFRASPSGPIPNGTSQGRALILPGTFLARPIALLTRLLFWKGKVVHAHDAYLKNRITPFGIQAIKAKVYLAPSWLDQNPCVVLDYSQTSRAAFFVRDEIRLVAPNLYLGIVFLGKTKTIHFAIQFPTP